MRKILRTTRAKALICRIGNSRAKALPYTLRFVAFASGVGLSNTLLFMVFALGITLSFSSGFAQNVEGQIVASQFGQYQVPGIISGSMQFSSESCQVSGGGKNFAAFTSGVAIKIVDSNPARDEIQTPTAVFISACGVSMSTTYVHAMPFYLTSGTGGLQEALLNGPVRGGGPNIPARPPSPHPAA